jgi:predicted TIM-barrel fold metal-dependent hydrolase
VIGGFRVFDSHTHLGHARHSGRVMDVGTMLRHMDAVGIDRQLLIPFPVVADERAEHDLIAAAVRSYPDRFCGAMCLDPFQPDQQLQDELRRGVEELGLRAFKIQPQFCGLNPTGSRAAWLFGLANEYKLPVVFHTGAGAPFALPSLLIFPARQYPQLPIIVAHSGSPLYYLEAIVAASVCENLLLDVSSLMPHQALEVLKHVPAHRVMAGSDLPESAVVELGKIVDAQLSPEVKQAVLWDTPRRVFDQDA